MALVKHNGKNVYYCNFTSRLMPGINEIPEGELKALLLHPLFQHRVEEGIIVIIPESSDKEADGKKSVKEMMKLFPRIPLEPHFTSIMTAITFLCKKSAPTDVEKKSISSADSF